ncbi:MAG: hypothetical protein M0R23_08915 [Bacteroidales bacterium]|jgi:hypothetical protein|nr:hypothetical protein [Bacteroidales bacterium]
MSRSTWNIYTKVAGSWVSDGTIYRPNESLNFAIISTQSKTMLADGSSAYFTPSIKYNSDTISFIWIFDDGTMKTKVEGYMNAGTDIKIIDHNSTEYIGRFISIDSTWQVGLSSDRYDIKSIFQLIPSIA